MSKLKYSLERSFNAYILLMYYQRTDPWVDSDQWVISQRWHKEDSVYYNDERILFLVALAIQGKRNNEKYKKSMVLG